MAWCWLDARLVRRGLDRDASELRRGGVQIDVLDERLGVEAPGVRRLRVVEDQRHARIALPVGVLHPVVVPAPATALLALSRKGLTERR